MALHPEKRRTLIWSLRGNLLLEPKGRQPSGLPPLAPALLGDWMALSLQNLCPFLTFLVPVGRELFPIGFWFPYQI